MSVIFKTLEKVRSSSLSQEKKGGGPKRSRNIYSFRRIVISPLGVLCLAVLLILSALFSTYGGNFFGDYFSGNNKQDVTRNAKPVLHAAIDVRSQDQALRGKNRSLEASAKAHEMTHEEDLPEPPADIPVESVKPGGQYLPPSDLKKTSSPAASNPQYSPPKSQTRLEKPSGTVERTMGRPVAPKEQILSGNEPGERPLDPSDGKSPKDGSKLPTGGVLSRGTPPSDNAQISYTSPSAEEKMKADGGKGATEQRTIRFEPGGERLSVTPDVARDDDTTDFMSSRKEGVPDLLACLDRDGLAVSRPVPEKPSTSKGGKDPRAERIYKVNLEKAARVGRMVSKIERSMIEGDMDHAKVLIDQLAELKGEESPYFLKLMAVWHMRQRDYESAASLLTRVLEKKEDDLEAGINMAIIEIKTHRLDEARKRLAGLREIYQANTLIPELIRETGG
jgi:hypothetical protein